MCFLGSPGYPGAAIQGGVVRRTNIIAWKSNGSLLWTTPLALMVTLPGAALITIAVVVWQHRDFGAAGTVMGLIGGTLVVVGAGCWIESVIYTRHESLDVPSEPTPLPAGPREVRQHAVVRRPNGATYYVLTIVFASLPLTVFATSLDTTAYGPPVEPATLGILLTAIGGLAWLILGGVTARFVVRPHEFQVDSMLRSTRVPRGLVGTFDPTNTDVRLTYTAAAGHVTFRVDSPLADWVQRGTSYRHNRRTQIRTIQKIIDALADVPAATAAPAEVTKQWRPVFVTATLVCAAAIVAGSLIVALNWSSLPNGG
jgi:hypothetical protein